VTGAGISTSSGIPDYRSSHETILPTGPGKWHMEKMDLDGKQKKL